MWYDNLNNKRLWKIFSDISAIPRESGNEEGIRNYLLSWAKEHDIQAFADNIGNVIMKVKATPGYEDYPSIALQGHMDMVCVKREGSKHDFTKDPIEIMTDGKNIWAKDTSLGADNGIAIALALDIFSDEKASLAGSDKTFSSEILAFCLLLFRCICTVGTDGKITIF